MLYQGFDVRPPVESVFPKYVLLTEAHKYIPRSSAAIKKLVLRGKLKAVKSGGRVQISLDEIKRFLTGDASEQS